MATTSADTPPIHTLATMAAKFYGALRGKWPQSKISILNRGVGAADLKGTDAHGRQIFLQIDTIFYAPLCV